MDFLKPRISIDTPIGIEEAKAFYSQIGLPSINSRLPMILDRSMVIDPKGLEQLYAKAQQEYQLRLAQGGLHGLTEWISNLEYSGGLPLMFTEITQGLLGGSTPKKARDKVVMGLMHTHPVDMVQSTKDVNTLLRSNQLLHGVVTNIGRIFLIIKEPTWLVNQPNDIQIAFTSLETYKELGSKYRSRLLRLLFEIMPDEIISREFIQKIGIKLNFTFYEGDMNLSRLHKVT